MSLDKTTAEVKSTIQKSTNFLCPILTQQLIIKMKNLEQILNWIGHTDNKPILNLSWITVAKKVNNG